jgi:hypothetical protein
MPRALHDGPHQQVILNLYIRYEAASAASHVTTCRGDGNEAKTHPLTCFGPLVCYFRFFVPLGSVFRHQQIF